mmetsp:Transcript_136070/g.261352  ORF Transcript_136070/g.261352 Transcript_136070/m.261352 type:complete len:257 (+) Transcript_136070:916-1686(+)
MHCSIPDKVLCPRKSAKPKIAMAFSSSLRTSGGCLLRTSNPRTSTPHGSMGRSDRLNASNGPDGRSSAGEALYAPAPSACDTSSVSRLDCTRQQGAARLSMSTSTAARSVTPKSEDESTSRFCGRTNLGAELPGSSTAHRPRSSWNSCRRPTAPFSSGAVTRSFRRTASPSDSSSKSSMRPMSLLHSGTCCFTGAAWAVLLHGRGAALPSPVTTVVPLWASVLRGLRRTIRRGGRRSGEPLQTAVAVAAAAVVAAA